MPYFCIRFPRDGQHLILTCCNGVGPALQNNKNNFLFIWIIIIKVFFFKKIPFYICLLSPNALLLHPLSKRRTAFNFDMLQRRRICLKE
ncbi:hypothetical protein F3B27_23480 [Bacteroides fragilis]|nr:hypothetical protein F3B27_23480 [Bacteroides fragilis]